MTHQTKTYRSAKPVVACDPWEAPPYIDTEHSTESAAERAAERAESEFRQHNGSTAYGYAWIAGIARLGETARQAARRIVREAKGERQ